MGQMIDTVNPANIPASWNGSPAVRISVLAAAGADAYDIEDGNASVSEVAPQLVAAEAAGRPVIAYVNETTHGQLVAAKGAHGFTLRAATEWPAAGTYLWCACPGIPVGAVPAWAAVHPVAVQDSYLVGVDLSTTFGPFPGRVAGYVDGPVSAWPAAAWARFVELTRPPSPGPAPTPTPGPAPGPDQGDTMALAAADIDALVLALRREYTPGSELFDRTVQAAIQAIRECGLTHDPGPPAPPPSPPAPSPTPA